MLSHKAIDKWCGNGDGNILSQAVCSSRNSATTNNFLRRHKKDRSSKNIAFYK